MLATSRIHTQVTQSAEYDTSPSTMEPSDNCQGGVIREYVRDVIPGKICKKCRMTIVSKEDGTRVCACSYKEYLRGVAWDKDTLLRVRSVQAPMPMVGRTAPRPDLECQDSFDDPVSNTGYHHLQPRTSGYITPENKAKNDYDEHHDLNEKVITNTLKEGTNKNETGLTRITEGAEATPKYRYTPYPDSISEELDGLEWESPKTGHMGVNPVWQRNLGEYEPGSDGYDRTWDVNEPELKNQVTELDPCTSDETEQEHKGSTTRDDLDPYAPAQRVMVRKPKEANMEVSEKTIGILMNDIKG